MLLLLVIFAAFVSAEAQENANYKYTLSDDGKIATVTVTLDGYEKADSMMIIPDFDENNLSLIEGDWLLRGVIRDGWNEDTGDAVIAFSKPTDVNLDVFEMVFEVKGDAAALDSVKCDIIVKAISDEEEETEPPMTETVKPNPDTAETEPTYEPPEDEQPVYKSDDDEEDTEYTDTEESETEYVGTETQKTKETEPVYTDVVESGSKKNETSSEETSVAESSPTETSAALETEETHTPDKPASGSYPYYYGVTADADNYKKTVFLIVGVAVAAGVALTVIIVIRSGRKKR